MADPVIQVFDDAAALAEGAADCIVTSLRAALQEHERVRIALAGGSTPRRCYELIATRGDDLDWSRVDFLWSDERVVPLEDDRSNVHMARKAMLGPLEIADAQVFAPRTELGPQSAAMAYAIAVRNLCAGSPPVLDLVLLGLGEDGHTASLFPGEEALTTLADNLVAASRAPVEPFDRVTMTLPLINAAKEAIFLVSGESKRDVLARVLAREDLPAARVRADRTVWLVDASARGATQ